MDAETAAASGLQEGNIVVITTYNYQYPRGSNKTWPDVSKHQFAAIGISKSWRDPLVLTDKLLYKFENQNGGAGLCDGKCTSPACKCIPKTGAAGWSGWSMEGGELYFSKRTATSTPFWGHLSRVTSRVSPPYTTLQAPRTVLRGADWGLQSDAIVTSCPIDDYRRQAVADDLPLLSKGLHGSGRAAVRHPQRRLCREPHGRSARGLDMLSPRGRRGLHQDGRCCRLRASPAAAASIRPTGHAQGPVPVRED